MAGARKRDVYMGVDVFGRNTYGGGGMSCNIALTAAKSAGLTIILHVIFLFSTWTPLFAPPPTPSPTHPSQPPFLAWPHRSVCNLGKQVVFVVSNDIALLLIRQVFIAPSQKLYLDEQCFALCSWCHPGNCCTESNLSRYCNAFCDNIIAYVHVCRSVCSIVCPSLGVGGGQQARLAAAPARLLGKDPGLLGAAPAACAPTALQYLL